MATLRERILARCPYDEAPGFLHRFFESLGRSETVHPDILRLSIPLASFGTSGGIVVSHDVDVALSRLDDFGIGRHRTAVAWSQVDEGLFPTFDGELTIEAQEDRGVCVLSLDGWYEPPLEVAGAAVDAVTGGRIAKATARELLRELRRIWECACRLKEAAASR